jgi:EpsI family protein
MIVRLLLLAAVLITASVTLGAVTRSEIVPVRKPFLEFPMTLAAWNGKRLADFDAKIVEILGVDEYLTRVYSRPGAHDLHLYVGYHDSQRQGDTIHSPLNCLPGAGWEPTKFERVMIPVSMARGAAPQPVEVNRVIIQKGLERQLVYYWYQSHGRVVASEYWGRIFMVVDAIRFNRTDGAMVRVISPLPDAQNYTDESEKKAEENAVAFVQTLFPVLEEFLPE